MYSGNQVSIRNGTQSYLHEHQAHIKGKVHKDSQHDAHVDNSKSSADSMTNNSHVFRHNARTRQRIIVACTGARRVEKT
jgi:hypothetical protein